MSESNNIQSINMKNKLVMAHDLGTSGNKAILANENGNIIASSFSGYETYYPEIGWAEQNQQDWWDAFRVSTIDLLEKVPGAKRNIAAISFSGQMMGCTPVNKAGRPLCRAIIWSDQRAFKQKEVLSSLIDDDIAYKTTGTVMIANYLAAKICWLKDNHSEIYKDTYKFLQAKDFIVLRLTGKFCTDYSDASATNLFDIKKKEWNGDILSTAGIDIHKLPELAESTKVVGRIKSDIAEEIGLRAGLPVVIGGGDGPCATVGAGASKSGTCYNIYGSSSWNSLTTSEPLYDDLRRTFILNHLDPNLYMSLGTMQSAGASFEWLKNWINDSEGSSGKNTGITFEELLRRAENAEVGSKGLIFLPYLMGERSPYWDTEVKGAFLGLTRVTGKNEITRSVLEGVVYHLKIILDILEENSGKIPEIRLIGGGGKSRLLQKIMADIWGKTIISMEYMEEATSLGAAIAGFIGIGAIKDFYEAEQIIKINDKVYPDEANSMKYLKYYEIFKQAYNDLKKINHKIDRILKQ